MDFLDVRLWLESKFITFSSFKLWSKLEHLLVLNVQLVVHLCQDENLWSPVLCVRWSLLESEEAETSSRQSNSTKSITPFLLSSKTNQYFFFNNSKIQDPAFPIKYLLLTDTISVKLIDNFTTKKKTFIHFSIIQVLNLQKEMNAVLRNWASARVEIAFQG